MTKNKTERKICKKHIAIVLVAICCAFVTIPSRFMLSFETLREIFHLDKLQPQIRHFPHVIPPDRSADSSMDIIDNPLSDLTLRQYLSNSQGFHLAMAPAFFGFYAYFGALTTLHESVLLPHEREEGKVILPVRGPTTATDREETQEQEPLLKSVAGASAGAIAAVLIASGLNPRESAEFASSMTYENFADPPGFGGMLKGNMFEGILVSRLKRLTPGAGNRKLEDGRIPVAVTGFDLLSMSGKVLTEGCMGRAARASATFPGLFQPVGWVDSKSENEIEEAGYSHLTRLKRRYIPDALLIDGGVDDRAGLNGLAALLPHIENKRIVSFAVNGFGSRGPLGPSSMPMGLNASEVVSISIENAPGCGPWAMENGPRAVQAARDAIKAVLDLPMYRGEEDGHYVVRIDVTAFVPV